MVVGYAGGTTPNPTYEVLGDYTESVEITFTPSKISYEELLKHFWQQHDATIPQKRQYRSVIFYHDDAQRIAAQQSKEAIEADKGPVTTSIEYAGTFYPAEEYHQNYLHKKGLA